MTRKIYLRSALALGLLAVATFGSPSYCRVVSSAKSVGCLIRDVRRADSSMNLVERILFSMALAGSSDQASATPK